MIKNNKISKGLSDKEEELSKEYYNAMIATNTVRMLKRWLKVLQSKELKVK